jgi:hypothetical protein
MKNSGELWQIVLDFKGAFAILGRLLKRFSPIPTSASMLKFYQKVFISVQISQMHERK